MKADIVITVFTCTLLACASTVTRGEEPFVVRPPQFTPPASGITIDQGFEIRPNTMPPTDCISVVRDQTTIQISKTLLEHLRASKPSGWKTERERLASILGSRAEALLENLMKSKDASGCTIVQQPVSTDSLYLISQLLNSGQVAIIDNETNQRASHIFVRYQGLRSGPVAGRGHISYSLTQGKKPFLVIE